MTSERRDENNDLLTQDYSINMFSYGAGLKFFIPARVVDVLLFIILENDFSLTNLSAKVKDADVPFGQSRKDRMHKKLIYSFRLALEGRTRAEKIVSSIRAWIGFNVMDFTDFLNRHLPTRRKEFSSQYAPLTVGLSFLLF